MTGVVLRTRLLARLDAVTAHRLTAVVADAGFGKSVLLKQWLVRPAQPDVVVLRPRVRDVPGLAGAFVDALRDGAPAEASRLALVTAATPGSDAERVAGLAGLLCAALESVPNLQLVFVVDDAHLLDAPAGRFVEALVRQAPVCLHLLLLSRQPLPFSVDRLGDEVQLLGGADLAFDDDEMAQLFRAVVGDEGDVESVRALLGRRPAAVRLAAERLARSTPDARAALQEQGAPELLTLAAELLQGEPEPTRRLASVVAPYDRFTAELAEALGCAGAADTIAGLERRGLVIRYGATDWLAIPRLLRDYLRQHLPVDPRERPALVRAGGEWLEQHGQAESALRCAVDLGDAAWTARLLRAHGRDLVGAGRAARVLEALALVPEQDRDADLHEVEGAVHDSLGDTDRALACYLAAGAGREVLSPWLAWRTGYLHYQLGDLEQALAVLTRGGPPADTVDVALQLAWQATVHWARGEVADGRQVAEPALVLAERLDDPAALAAAHTVLALLAAHEGDRDANRRHYDVALEQAERAGDLMQVVRIRNNRGSRLLEEGELAAALEELEIAIELAEAGGLRFYLSLALANRGEVRLHLGQLDAATADLEKARDLGRAAGSSSVSAAVVQLGHVYRHRGYLTMSRQSYEEAIAAGRQTGEVPLLVPALCGLAQLLAETDTERAQQLAEQALAFDSGLARVGALLAGGWVALAGGRPGEAARLAEEAHADAVQRRDRLGRAEALHLIARTDPEQRPDDPRLAEAATLLEQVGAPVWRARVGLEQARRDHSAAGLTAVAQIQQLARSLGARALAEQAAHLARGIDVALGAAPVEIGTLGGFRVRRHGGALALTDWPHESARALLVRLTAGRDAAWARAPLAR
ncbi:MAG: transcriptional activator domain protein, partial [Frankiales bacterium]|nr:transcriptional activator domain protein [Frankiales bacterium]